jgi:hypothetical protein
MYTSECVRTTNDHSRPRRACGAKRLAAAWHVTPSEAIRRALLRVANEELFEHRAKKRRHRSSILDQLIKISKGQDVQAEIRRLCEERDAS